MNHIDLRPGQWQFYIAALAGLMLAYWLAFWMTLGIGVSRAILYSIVPVTGIAILAVPARALILHQILRLKPVVQAVGHFVTAITFSILLYWLRTVINGVALSGDLMHFTLPSFFAPGAAWMLIEGVLLYVLLALTAYIEVLRATALALPDASLGTDESSAPFRLFTRQGDEFRPIDPARIILARGADDYAEVVTGTGTHLVRMTLSSLRERLGARFIRVHRSCIVNVERIAKAEPAGGGRMLLHMENGAMITSSRAGARLLREHVV